MANCRQCGTMLDEGAQFCANCGTEANESTYDEQNPYAPPQQSVPDYTVNKNPWQYFTGVFKKYAVFKGRARRAEYWWFVLFNVVVSVIASILDVMLNLYITGSTGVINTLWSLVVFIPSLSVTARRMHDCDRSGWCMLIPIYNFILTCTNGTYGPNRFGPDPKLDNSDTETEPVP